MTAAEEAQQLKALLEGHAEMCRQVERSALVLQGIMKELVRRGKLSENPLRDLEHAVSIRAGSSSPEPELVDLDSRSQSPKQSP